MNNEMAELPKSLMTSTVYHKDRAFCVSTINRESSAVEMYGAVYAETIVWELKNGERGSILYMEEGSKGSVLAHLNVCKQLFETGEYKEDQK